MFHGNVYSRWFDKSFTTAVYANGVVGSNIEHSLLDATVSDTPFTGNCNIIILYNRFVHRCGSSCFKEKSMMKMAISLNQIPTMKLL